MELEHITTKRCPICGSLPIYEAKDSQHCSGEWNESRKFKCGYKETYSPNFRSISTLECPKNPVIIELERKRILAREQIIEYINNVDADNNFIDGMISSMPSDWCFRYPKG